MKSHFLTLGVALLILALVLANLLVFDGRDSGNVAPSPVRARTTPALQQKVKLALGPGTAGRRALVQIVEAVPASASGGIAGVVVGAGGHGPLSGASVRLATPASAFLTTTDERGAFRMADLDPGRHDVYVSAPGWAPAFIEDVEIVVGESKHFPVTLEKARSLVVEVHAGSGDALEAPVSDAIVRLYPGGAAARRISPSELERIGIMARTGRDGRARVDEVRPGNYFALVRAPDYPVWTGDMLVQEQDDVVRIVLQSGGVIEGRVLDSDGRPSTGRVFIGPARRLARVFQYYGADSAILDQRGEFRITGVPVGEHHLVAVLTRGEFAVSDEALSVTSDETVEVELQAARNGTVRGRVTDQVGTPLAGAEVTVGSNSIHHSKGKSFPGVIAHIELTKKLIRSTLTDAGGRYVLENVRTIAGRLKVSAKLKGHAKRSEYPTSGPGQDVVQNIVLVSLDSLVAGRVRGPFPDALGGVTIIAKTEGFSEMFAGHEGSYLGTTRDDGSFEIAVPSSRSFRIISGARDFTPPSRIEPVIIDGVASGSQNVEFVLVPTSFLRLRVVDGDGVPVGTLEISLFDDVQQGFETRLTESHSDGHYEIPIDPERHLFANLCSAGFEPLEIWDLQHKLEEVVIVEMVRSGEDVPIRVEDAEGNPVAGAGVTLAWFGTPGAYPLRSKIVPSVRTNAAGEGTLRAVPTRAPRDFLVAPGLAHAPPVIHLKAPQLGNDGPILVLRVPCSTEVRLRLLGPGGEPANGGCLVAAGDGTPLATRAFASLHATKPRETIDPMRPIDGRLVLHLAPGRYTLNYLPRGALPDDVRFFDFTVREDAENTFSFQVE